MRLRRRHVLPTAAVVAATAGAAAVPAVQDTVDSAVAQTTDRTELSDVLAQLRRNAKVSERLNAGFFRAPQTRQFAGSTFNPIDDAIAYDAANGDFSIRLEPTRTGDEADPTTGEFEQVPQTTGTFEIPLDIPNRAEVIGVSASYRDAAGNNNDAPSGLGFSVIKMGHLGDNQEQLLALPQGANPALGFRSNDNTVAALHALPLANNGFRVDNSRHRYVLRVRIDDTSEETRFNGFTIRYVIGRGVPGAPTQEQQGQ